MPDSGSAPNKTFTREVATFTGSDAFQQLQASGRKILSIDQDEVGDDIAAALNNRLMKDGGNWSVDVDIQGHKFTNVGNASARTHFASAGQVADGGLVYAGTSSGTDTITASVTPAITAYATGQRFTIKAGGTNTGAATINFNSVGAKDIKKGAAGSTALVAGDITTGGIYDLEYDGTNFQLLNPGSQNFTITAAGAALLDDADAAAQRTTLGLVIGTNVQAFDADTLKADVADTLTAGFNATEFDAGTKTTGTFTPDPASGNFQKAVNGGAHTLAPPGSTCSIVIQYTNNGSAGAITTSGFTKVDGSFTTTNGHDFMCYVVRNNGFSHLNIVALQ